MTSHEQWLKSSTNKITKSSQGRICWNSSESDQDDFILESPIKKRRLSIGSSSSGRSEISKDENLRSPALNSNWKQDSPVLNSRSRLDVSPILVNKHKRCRRKVERKLDLVPLYCTPDLFGSQPSQTIEDDIPDDKSDKFELDVTKATQIESTQLSAVIEPIFSQNASIVAEYGSANSNEMAESTTSDNSSYNMPRKKKKYKKGSLSRKVYNMIQSQRFRYTVWKIHKHNSIVNDTRIKCSVKKTWKNYGTTFLECNIIESYRDATERTILICLSPMLNITLEIGSVCELFAPFIEKTVLYHNQDVTCYINVIKIHQIAQT